MNHRYAKKYLPVALSILIAQSAGMIGSLFTARSVDTWYVTLAKPLWNPPSWIFGPVWITLYALMGIAAYLVWQKRDAAGRYLALSMYGIQLALNALWSFIFFGARNLSLAYYEIIVLWGVIVVTAVLFWRIDRRAGFMMIPYILWVFFAAMLTFTIWQMNR